MKATIYMVAGPSGAGKTTHATKLAAEVNGVTFSIDTWMASLFGPDLTSPLEPRWVLERMDRCNRRILSTALAIASCGVNTVLDLGLARRSDRTAIAEACGGRFAIEFHWLDAPADERWLRVERRNHAKDAGYAFDVTRPMFDFSERACEPPDEAELVRLNGKRMLS